MGKQCRLRFTITNHPSSGVRLLKAVGPDLRARDWNGRLPRHRVHGVEEATLDYNKRRAILEVFSRNLQMFLLRERANR